MKNCITQDGFGKVHFVCSSSITHRICHPRIESILMSRSIFVVLVFSCLILILVLLSFLELFRSSLLLLPFFIMLDFHLFLQAGRLSLFNAGVLFLSAYSLSVISSSHFILWIILVVFQIFIHLSIYVFSKSFRPYQALCLSFCCSDHLQLILNNHISPSACHSLHCLLYPKDIFL